jgi:MoaA/NifB/PqqE/SkfB family radical SAM enzyme
MDEFELEERPKTRVQWLLGNRCNYQCSYCHEIFRKGDKAFPDDDLVLEVCQTIIAHYDELNRDVVFEFIGGEPSLIEKIPYIGERLHNHPVSIVLKTNGSASLEWWKDARRYLGSVVITMHREFCDENHIYNVIDLLKNDPSNYELDLKLLIAVTNHQESWDWGLKNLKRFRNAFEVGELQLLYSNFGSGSNMYLPYSERQWAQYVELGGYQPKPVTDDKLFRPVPGYKNFKCHAGIETLVIDSTGKIYRGWCLEGGEIGNIYNLPITLPTEPIICSKEICGNGFDQQALKEINQP